MGNEDTCDLCGANFYGIPNFQLDLKFCCSGCLLVYNILSSKQMLNGFEETAVFKQALQSGLISNPHLIEKINLNKSEITNEEIVKIHFEIEDMWCPSCAEVIKLVLLQQKGVKNCVVDYATDLAAIYYAPKFVSKDQITHLIAALGYKSNALEDSGLKKSNLDLYLKLGVASFSAMNTMMFSYPLYASYNDPDAYLDGRLFAELSLFAVLPVLLYSMLPIYKRFYNSIRFGLIGMEALVVIGVFASFGLSIYNMLNGINDVYFDTIAVIVSFMLFGKMIESRVKFSSKLILHKIIKTLPKKARKKFEDGSVQFVPLKEVKIDDTIMTFTGEKVVMDGVLIEGECSIDESLITGESKPVYKTKGDTLVGGSIITKGNISYSVTKTAGNTTLDKIVELVQEEVKNKALYERAADHVVRCFVPFVIFAAIFNWLISSIFFNDTSFVNSVSLLLIACPCALGIAAPLAESKMLYEIMQLGAFVKNRGVLKVLPKINSFVFDKTGTVTKGNFSVLEGIESLSSNHKGILKALSEKSNHPISRAIYEYLACINTLSIENIEEHSGKGMKATHNGQICLLGSKKLLQEHHRTIQSEYQDSFTTVYFSPSNDKVFSIKLGDSIKEEVYTLIDQLPGDKILLSGDSESVVADISKKLNFKNYQHSFLPHMKKDYIDALRKNNEIVCMIGDGINDAPAIAAANVGISVISATDLSSQVSDILLTVDKLSVLTDILKIAKKGDSIIKQNLFWAFFYNVIGMGLAITGNLTPLYSAIAMVLSSFIVIINSKRI